MKRIETKPVLNISIAGLALLLLVPACELLVQNQAPTLEVLSPDNGSEFSLGEDITISAEANDPDGTISEVRFYINDIGVGSSDSFPYNYSWNTSGEEEGVHNIKVTALDNSGASVSDDLVIILNVAGEPPVAAFTTSATMITARDTIYFTDASTNEPLDWAWDFGDGGTSQEQHPYHIYMEAGKFTVELTVSNAIGSDTETKTDYIDVLVNNEPVTGTFVDPRDNKTYKTVQLGKQTWMAENLAYLPEVHIPSDESSTLPRYYVYGNISTSPEKVKTAENYVTYGVLYNWPAADRSCPDGWHLPTDAEWETLAEWISEDNGGLAKENDDWKSAGLYLKSTSGWDSGGHGLDDYHFNALPGGERSTNGTYNRITYGGNWWSATDIGGTDAYTRALDASSDDFLRYYFLKEAGFSVRCVKDE